MIELRPVEESDLDAFYEFQSDPEAVDMAAFGGSRDRETHFEVWTTKIMVNPDGVARTVLVDGRSPATCCAGLNDGESASRLLDRPRVLGPRRRD